jgi:hypothetical protein
MIAEALLIKDENRYLLEHKKCRLFVGGIFYVARETLRLREIAGRSGAVNSCVGCISVA